jgi:hypothetical protein
MGEATVVERCLTETPITTPWDLLLLTPLALASRDVDVARLEAGLVSLHRHGLIRLNQLKDAWSDGNTSAEYQEIDWFVLHAGQYERSQPDAQGLLRSEVFPGLWFDATALLRGDLASVLTAVQYGLASPEHAAFVARLSPGAQD